LPAPLSLAAEQAELIALIKPQFEAGPDAVGKGGVVRDPAIHKAVCERVAAWLDAQSGWTVVGLTDSPVLGPAGNREFLIHARCGGKARPHLARGRPARQTTVDESGRDARGPDTMPGPSLARPPASSSRGPNRRRPRPPTPPA